MSFGVVQAAITSLKNNKRERKSKFFDKKSGLMTGANSIENDITSSPEQLAQLRQARKTQQKRLLVKRIIATVIGGGLVAGIMTCFYMDFN